MQTVTQFLLTVRPSSFHMPPKTHCPTMPHCMPGRNKRTRNHETNTVWEIDGHFLKPEKLAIYESLFANNIVLTSMFALRTHGQAGIHADRIERLVEEFRPIVKVVFSCLLVWTRNLVEFYTLRHHYTTPALSRFVISQKLGLAEEEETKKRRNIEEKKLTLKKT